MKNDHDIKQQVILPPQFIGIIGGGQLGRMLAIAAKQFGYQVIILSPELCPPASYIADMHIQAPYNDIAALQQLLATAKVITTEFEHIPVDALTYLTQAGANLYPTAEAILITQNRLKEKRFIQSLGLATADFIAINSANDCDNAVHLLPGILKTNTMGYDSKGQIHVNSLKELLAAYKQLAVPCILEKHINISAEYSIIIAKNTTGLSAFPVIENSHHQGILVSSILPAKINKVLYKQIFSVGSTIAAALNYIGVLTVELFYSSTGELLVNELAPRPHNSGHITLETHVNSQFQQQLRAICGLPLAVSTSTHSINLNAIDIADSIQTHGIMCNILGEHVLGKRNYAMLTQQLLTRYPNMNFHWYEKDRAVVGRKLGHCSLILHTYYSDMLAHLAQITDIIKNN